MKISTGNRRAALQALLSTALVVATHVSDAEEAPLLSEDDTAAKGMHYVSDVSRAKDAKPGSKCANCSLYAGDSKSTQAVCGLFGNKQVLANGWCEAWTNV